MLTIITGRILDDLSRTIHFDNRIETVEASELVGFFCYRRLRRVARYYLPTVLVPRGGCIFLGSHKKLHLFFIIACSVTSICYYVLTSATTSGLSLWLSVTTSQNLFIKSGALAIFSTVQSNELSKTASRILWKSFCHLLNVSRTIFLSMTSTGSAMPATTS